jgi:hypothetical protein
MWIVDDITQAIANVNQNGGGPTNDILHNPIKQLEKLSNISAVVSTDPNDLTSGVGSATPSGKWTVSPTGRVSNAFYDVIRFKLVLLVDAAKVPQVLRGLQMGEFITIWNAQIDAVVDPAIMAQAGYRFGDQPVVRLEIDGEDLLLKSWSNDLLPDERKGGVGPGGVPFKPGTPGAPTPANSNSNNEDTDQN